MNGRWLLVCALAVDSFAQTYTVSAKPGALNFIQGAVSINGDPVWKANLRTTFLNANDVLTVENGKAEVLLTPGVFLRLGEHSEVRMIKPSLLETQLEVLSGESMVEVDDLEPGSSVAVMDHGSSTTLTKPGLFRFTDHSIAALDGKADVAFGDRKLVLNKNREVQIDDTLKAAKLNLNQPDELYAWSNTRAQYNAAASYAGSTAAYNSGGYGYGSGPGSVCAGDGRSLLRRLRLLSGGDHGSDRQARQVAADRSAINGSGESTKCGRGQLRGFVARRADFGTNRHAELHKFLWSAYRAGNGSRGVEWRTTLRQHAGGITRRVGQCPGSLIVRW
jgi:hypothetical protein